MASQDDALRGLFDEREPISAADLAKKVGSTEDTLRSQLSKLKNKGYVEGSAKEGWIITSEGKGALERQTKIPTTPQDVGADTESKLKYYGQLATVPPDVILATVELILTGDPEDLDEVWKHMTEMDVPIAARRRWWHLWRNYLKQAIPPQLKEKVSGPALETEEGEGEAISVGAKEKGRDYIIVDDLPVFVGAGQGDYGLKDAKDLVGMRALRARFAGHGGGTASGAGQQFGPQDIINILDKVKEVRGEGAAPKTYVVQPTDQGTVVKEVQPGEPLVVSPPGAAKPPATFFVDNAGNVQEVQPGHPIVIRQQGNPPPAPKTLVVRQTDKGIVTEEFEAGKPIILGSSSPGTGMPPGLPFPVFGSDGQPVYDKDGKPVYANLEPTLKWLGFQGEQRRADERHGALMGLVKTVQENLGDGVAALKAAAEEAKAGAKPPAPTTPGEQEQPQLFRCGDCKTQFGPPAGWAGQPVICPGCGREYSREELGI
ncbi:hypothetical protein ES703_89284 [subsurface metagenome]